MLALEAELWTWYAVTIIVVAARLTSRRMLHGSFFKLQIDDFIMVLSLISLTVVTIGIRILIYTPTNLIKDVKQVFLTKENIALRVYGSKIVIVVEQMQIFLIWSVKVCLLIIYSRLTTSLKQHFFVKITIGYTACCFVVMEILFFAAWCRPFWHYWQVPTDNINCSMERDHLITNTVFNISSDLMILALPMPVFLKAQLPPKRKAILVGVFLLGLFTILSALLSKAYSFGDPYSTKWIVWYIREANTAIIVANLPFTWTLLQRIFKLRSFHAKSTADATPRVILRFQSSYGNLASITSRPRTQKGISNFDPSATESQGGINSIHLKIYQQNEVHITTGKMHTKSGISTIPKGDHPAAYIDHVNSNIGGSQERLSDDKSPTRDGEIGNVTTIGHGISRCHSDCRLVYTK